MSVRYFFLWVLMLSTPAWGALDRRITVGLGGGMPMLLGGEASVRTFSRWHIGTAIGVIPTTSSDGFGYSPSYQLPEQEITLKQGFVLILTPNAATNLAALTPFVRFFPSDRNFYIQFAVGLMRAKTIIRSQVRDLLGHSIPDIRMTGNVELLQLVPTLSMGHIFQTQLFFFNVTMGLSVLATVYSTTSFQGEIPDALGGMAENQEVVDDANARTEGQANAAIQAFREQFPVIPSVSFTLGFLL